MQDAEATDVADDFGFVSAISVLSAVKKILKVYETQNAADTAAPTPGRFGDGVFLCGEKLINEERTRFLKYFVEFFGGHFSNGTKDDVLLDSEKSLRTNIAWVIDPAAFTIALIQRDGESIVVGAARDLTQNQIRAWKIGDHQCGPVLFGGGIVP